MSYIKRLKHAFKNAPILPVNQKTKYVFFSDCHRGIGDNNDNFLKNENEYIAALQYYYQYGFTYIEVGDGDELWENRNLELIMDMHNDVFSLLWQFYQNNRLYMLYGNHDMVKKYIDIFYEGIIMRAEHSQSTDNTDQKDILVTHGHQVDFLNSTLWRLARFLVRYLWTPLEYFGVQDPTSAAKNNILKSKSEQRLAKYATDNSCILLTGHTHRPMLLSDDLPLCNCGSCVHPRTVTCIELCGTQISLVKWCSSTLSIQNGGHLSSMYNKCPPEYPVYITREVITSHKL